MRIPLLLTVALSSLFWFPATAGEFARVLPEDAFLYVEVLDLPQLTTKQKDTPFGKALAQLDWKTLLLQLTQLEDAAVPEDLKEEGLLEVLNRMESAYNTISDQMNGSWVMAVGDLSTPIKVFSEHQGIRAEFLLDDMTMESLEEDDPKVLEQLKQQEELDLKELASLLGEISFYADVQDTTSLAGTLETWAKDLEPVLSEMDKVAYTTRDMDGVTLYGLSYTHSEAVPSIGLHWFLHKDVWVTTFTSASLEQALTRLVTPPAASLRAHPDFQETYPKGETTDTFTYFNMPVMDTWFRMAAEEAGDLPQTGNLNAEKILDWLGLDALLPITQTTLLEAEGSTTDLRMGFRRETGLSRLLLGEPEPVELPSMLHKDFPQFTAANWSIGAFWTRLETELMNLAPEAAAGMGMARMLATGRLGFDIKLQFFDHLDSGVIFVQTMDPEVMAELNKAMESDDPSAILAANSEHPTGGQNYLIGYETKNEEQIRVAMDRLMTRFFPTGKPAPEVVQGVEVFNPIPPGAAGGMINELVHFAFVDGWLLVVIGERDLLDEAIAASQDEALQIRKDPSFQALLAQLPADAFQLQYASGEQQEQAMKMATSSFQMMAPEGLEIPDLSFMAELYHQMLQATTRDGLILELKSIVTFGE